MTRIVKAKDGVDEGARILRDGGLVVFPTETVYGLGANAYDENAVANIFKAKGRPQDNPLIVHISSLEQVKDIAVDIPDEFYALAERFMPGKPSVCACQKTYTPENSFQRVFRLRHRLQTVPSIFLPQPLNTFTKI